MLSYRDLHEYYQILIPFLFLALLIINGHIMAFASIRIKHWGLSLRAFFTMLIYFVLIVIFSSFTYEINHNLDNYRLTKVLADLPLWSYLALLILGYYRAIVKLNQIRAYKETIISKASIKEGIDNLHLGLSLSYPNGVVILSNWQIDKLCHKLTGEALQNAEVFWNNLIQGELRDGSQRWGQSSKPNISMSSGRTWSFSRRNIQLEDKDIVEIMAVDTSHLNSLRLDLERDNKSLEEMAERLRQYSRDVIEIKAKEERFAAKMRIHDELGYAILAIRQFFRRELPYKQENPKTRETIDIWRKNTSILKGVRQEEKARALDNFISTAEAIGIAVETRGDLPSEDKLIKLILLTAGECLTNSVRHAYATEIQLDMEEEAAFYRVNFSNNGILPRTEIVEGGGLTSIRSRVEAIGGSMEISHRPRFNLMLLLPKKGAEELD